MVTGSGELGVSIASFLDLFRVETEAGASSGAGRGAIQANSPVVLHYRGEYAGGRVHPLWSGAQQDSQHHVRKEPFEADG